MQPKAVGHLADILSESDFILRQTRDFDFDSFATNETIQHAVAHALTIIGEATNNLRREDPVSAARITNYRRIVDFRNILIHDYRDVKLQRVWDVIQKSLPTLKVEVEQLLSEVEHSNE